MCKYLFDTRRVAAMEAAFPGTSGAVCGEDRGSPRGAHSRGQVGSATKFS